MKNRGLRDGLINYGNTLDYIVIGLCGFLYIFLNCEYGVIQRCTTHVTVNFRIIRSRNFKARFNVRLL